MVLHLKRVYDSPNAGDGLRILVDRLWPRGVKKEIAQLDYWLKDVAPSSELRKWFHSGSGTFEDFRSRYLEELDCRPETKEALHTLQNLITQSPVTLLYGSKDTTNNHAIVLKEWLEKTT
ncbi:MAG TPA: DUF488 domain-containing protein [Candidatus Angelobacter sp.]|nr:DUF488 domain-containing protein [Candidatus Angelobacter sp.]